MDHGGLTREDRVGGALLGTFAGDALGAPWEGAPPVAGRDPGGRVAASLRRGTLTYTDDTQMALALAEHLCSAPAVDPQGLAATFLDHYEPFRGYGSGTHAVVAAWRRGVGVAEAATAAFPEGSLGNGAAMRAAPVGAVWGDQPDRLRQVAARQAAVTHTHPVGVDGAVVLAAAVGLAARRGRFGQDELSHLRGVAATDELRAGIEAAATWAARYAEDDTTELAAVAAALGVQAVAHRSVPAALWAAVVAGDLAAAVGLALGLGGDADTVAAMAGGVCGAARGLEAVPEDWLAAMEDGPRGRSYALDLARRLAAVPLPV